MAGKSPQSTDVKHHVYHSFVWFKSDEGHKELCRRINEIQFAAKINEKKNEQRALEMLETHIKYIKDNIDSLENPVNVKRAMEMLETDIKYIKDNSPAATGVDCSHANAAAESSEKNYKRAVDMLETDIKYINDNIDSLENSGNVKRADVLLQFLMDATKKRTAADFKKGSVNLTKLLQIIAKLKLWVPPKPPEDEKNNSKDAVKKKEESPFFSSREKDKAASEIVEELFGLRCNQWGMDGLLKSYSELSDTEKLCLLCFSAFECEVEKVTEDEVTDQGEKKVDENEYMISKSLKIKKRILIHWWVAEGLIDLRRKEIASANPKPTSDIPTPNSDPLPNSPIVNSNLKPIADRAPLIPNANPTSDIPTTNSDPLPNSPIANSNPKPIADRVPLIPNPTSDIPTPSSDPLPNSPIANSNPKPIADRAPLIPNPNPTSEIPTPNSDPLPNSAIANSNPKPIADCASPIPNPNPTPKTPNTNSDPMTVEDIGEEILKKLKEKGFIDPVIKAARESSRVVMHPFVHSFVTALAKRAGFLDFSTKDGKLTPSFGLSQRACLVKWPDKESSCKVWEKFTDDRKKLKRFESVQTLFNVNEPIIDIKPEWFSKMKNLTILHLGSWRSEAVEHIEVEDTKFMEDLKTMVKMRLFSLQGVSTIMKLSDSVCKLENLVILDLRECHNLEELPVDIGCLKSLTHLDITNCHLLTKLPKGISLLSKLEVLKGFVIYDQVGDTQVGKRCSLHRWCKKAKQCVIHEVLHLKNKEECKLKDLEKLQELRQLSIVVNVKEFPRKEEVQVFREMRKLRKLKIAWEKSFKSDNDPSAKDDKTQSGGKCGWCCPAAGKKPGDGENPSATGVGKPDAASIGDDQQELSASCSSCLSLKCCNDNGVEKQPTHQSLDQIQKLELWGLPPFVPPNQDPKHKPERIAPYWLKPDQLKNLEKLYIKGGGLSKVPGDSDKAKVKWENIRTLRFKYLHDLKIDWLEFKAMFPNLEYLENLECGQLKYFPCDQEGVWKRW